MANPFFYSRPLSPDELVDRDEEAATIAGLVEGGHAVRLSAPRRYGKTSLLRRVLRDVDRLGMPAVYVDLYGVLSVHEIGLRLEEAYRSSLQGPVARAVVAVLRTLRPRVRAGIGVARVEAAPQAGRGDDDLELLHRLLDLPRKVHERTGRRTLVVFDEFQSLLAVAPNIDGLFRSRIQHHGAEAAYVFAGSRPGLMRELFGRRDRPFFGQAREVVLGRLAEEHVVELVAGGFERTGRDPGDALEPLLDLVDGHPQRAMLLAHFLWELTPPRGRADESTWQAALDAALADSEPALQAIWDSLDDGERRTYATVATGDGTLSKARLAALGVPPTTAYAARDRLIAEGDLERAGGRLVPVDPLFAEWVRRGRRAGPAE